MRSDLAFEDFGQSRGQHKSYKEVLLRRRWWIMAPFCLLGVSGYIAARFIRPLYASQAIILVEQQKVPEQYVTPSVISDLQYRLNSLTQQILSRTRLQRLIEDFGLYTRERARGSMDEVIDLMSQHIQVEIVQSPGRQNQLTAFKIRFEADSPRVAQRVTNELTSLFIEANVRSRTQQAVATTQFLESELEDARKNLMEQEQQLREYKTKHLGELPEQQQGNFQILSSLQSQLQFDAASLERAEQEKIYLESMRSEYETVKKALADREPAAQMNPQLAGAEEHLRELRAELEAKRAYLREEHPDIILLKKQVADAEDARDRIRAELRPKGGDPKTAAEPTEPSLIEVDSRLKATELELAGRRADIARLTARIEELQRKVDVVPMREQQLSEITRNYDNSKAYYQSLLQKKLGSELATNLEKRQQSEQFRILDPANLPERPSRLNRLQIVALGWLAGIAFGLGLAILREVLDTSLWRVTDLTGLTACSVLGRIPMLRSEREKRRTRFRWRLEAASAMLLVLLCLATSVQTYMAG